MSNGVNIGSSDFKFVSKQDYYVDKTAMLVPLMRRCQSGTSIIINRPRRFGKSLALSMIETFFSNETKGALGYFEGLEISRHDINGYIASFPVIRLSFFDISEESSFDANYYLKKAIAKVYDRFSTLKTDGVLSAKETREFEAILNLAAPNADYAASIRSLLEYINRSTGKKAIVLIDEYDGLFEKQGGNKDATEFFKSFLTATFKDNEYLGMGLLTGVFSLAKGSLGSGLNNIPVDNGLSTIFDENYFGFTEKEVLSLLSRYAIPKEKIGLLRDYYGGYLFNEQEFYNPWSVISYLNTGLILGYWVDSARREAFKELAANLDEEGNKDIGALVAGETLVRGFDFTISYENYLKSSDNILLYLVMGGYLAIRQIDLGIFAIRIVNKETRYAFSQLYYEQYRDKDGLKIALAMKSALLEGDGERIGSLLHEFLLSSLSYYDFNSEKNYQIMIGTIAALVFDDSIIKHEVIAGTGRCDIMVTPKSAHGFGAVVELKYFSDRKSETRLQASAKTALMQIQKRDYCDQLLKQRAEPVYAYGIAFYKSKVAVASAKIR